MNNSAYIDYILQLREKRNQRMAANPRNWLALVGLFWLDEGDNPFGNNAMNKIVLTMLPCQQCGVFHLKNGQVTLTTVEGEVTLNGGAVELRSLRADVDSEPDLVEVGSISMMVLKRGERSLLRVWDSQAPAVKEFKGFDYFPINTKFCLQAEFMPYEPPKKLKMIDVIGTERDCAMLGQARVTLNGVACTLEAEDSEDELLFSFTDMTKNDLTYPGGRYLAVPKPQTSQITLDFNLAVNWPCAYTSFATCPLPPFENRLPVRIEAGELKYHALKE